MGFGEAVGRGEAGGRGRAGRGGARAWVGCGAAVGAEKKPLEVEEVLDPFCAPVKGTKCRDK